MSAFFTNLGDSISQGFEFLKESIVDLGKTILNGISDILEFLFVPSNNLFDDVKELFNEKFGIFTQVGELLQTITFPDSSGMPVFNITLYGSTMKIIDFSMFDKYRVFIHNIIVMIAYFKFIVWLVNNAPAIVTGTGGSLSSKGVVE